MAVVTAVATSTRGQSRPARPARAINVRSAPARLGGWSSTVARPDLGSETGGDASGSVSGDTGVDITSVPAGAEVTTASGGAPERSGGGPTAESHDQFHVHSHVQRSGVPLAPWLASAVVASQNVNVQLQSHGSPAGVVVVGSDVEPAGELDPVWLTVPLSPGLSTRTETFVFPVVEEGAVVVTRAPSLDPEGADATDVGRSVVVPAGATPSSVHDHTQTHSHVQSSDAGFPVSVDDVVAFPSQSIPNHQLQYHGAGDDTDSD